MQKLLHGPCPGGLLARSVRVQRRLLLRQRFGHCPMPTMPSRQVLHGGHKHNGMPAQLWNLGPDPRHQPLGMLMQRRLLLFCYYHCY